MILILSFGELFKVMFVVCILRNCIKVILFYNFKFMILIGYFDEIINIWVKKCINYMWIVWGVILCVYDVWK